MTTQCRWASPKIAFSSYFIVVVGIVYLWWKFVIFLHAFLRAKLLLLPHSPFLFDMNLNHCIRWEHSDWMRFRFRYQQRCHFLLRTVSSSHSIHSVAVHSANCKNTEREIDARWIEIAVWQQWTIDERNRKKMGEREKCTLCANYKIYIIFFVVPNENEPSKQHVALAKVSKRCKFVAQKSE